eukprot:TRINITY_DN7204_c0_g1_i1.p1 TRINITY_DN7204_c0_g1~~TRINITY_DN7204_c0_g1_i1.p1  ORF type:complete len:215 (-),score=28.99 TRINITY_DN7204_c0_g1_i1:129-773(-)
MDARQEAFSSRTLKFAVSNGYHRIAVLCFRHPSFSNQDREWALQKAVRERHMSIVNAIISILGPEVPDGKFRTLIFHAVMQGDQEMVSHLLSLGAKVDVMDREGKTPIWFACRYGYMEILQLLEKHGADVFSTVPQRHVIRGALEENFTMLDAAILTLQDENAQALRYEKACLMMMSYLHCRGIPSNLPFPSKRPIEPPKPNFDDPPSRSYLIL